MDEPEVDIHFGENVGTATSDLVKASGLNYPQECILSYLYVNGMLTVSALRKALTAIHQYYKKTGHGLANASLQNISLNRDGNIEFCGLAKYTTDGCNLQSYKLNYSQIYLSLSGADEIVNGTQVPSAYRRQLLKEFDRYVTEQFGADFLHDVIGSATEEAIKIDEYFGAHMQIIRRVQNQAGTPAFTLAPDI